MCMNLSKILLQREGWEWKKVRGFYFQFFLGNHIFFQNFSNFKFFEKFQEETPIIQTASSLHTVSKFVPTLQGSTSVVVSSCAQWSTCLNKSKILYANYSVNANALLYLKFNIYTQIKSINAVILQTYHAHMQNLCVYICWEQCAI